MKIEDFEALTCAILTEEEREEDIETLGGLVFSVAGRVPSRGEVVRHESGIDFKVLEADPRRIQTIKIDQSTRCTQRRRLTIHGQRLLEGP